MKTHGYLGRKMSCCGMTLREFDPVLITHENNNFNAGQESCTLVRVRHSCRSEPIMILCNYCIQLVMNLWSFINNSVARYDIFVVQKKPVARYDIFIVQKKPVARYDIFVVHGHRCRTPVLQNNKLHSCINISNIIPNVFKNDHIQESLSRKIIWRTTIPIMLRKRHDAGPDRI